MTYLEFKDAVASKIITSENVIKMLEKRFNRQRLSRIAYIKKTKEQIKEFGIFKVRQDFLKIKDSKTIGDWKFRGSSSLYEK